MMPEERDPTRGPKPSHDPPEQEPPGNEGEMEPKADHGEESCQGSGKLEGLVALITGGDGGIGRAVAIAFAREGADATIGYLDGVEDRDAPSYVFLASAGARDSSGEVLSPTGKTTSR